jgi:hypothetical protein
MPPQPFQLGRLIGRSAPSLGGVDLAWPTHLPSVSAMPMPSSRATSLIAAHSHSMITGDLTDHPDRPLTQLGRTPSTCLLHDSNLSSTGVSGHASAVHPRRPLGWRAAGAGGHCGR